MADSGIACRFVQVAANIANKQSRTTSGRGYLCRKSTERLFHSGRLFGLRLISERRQSTTPARRYNTGMGRNPEQQTKDGQYRRKEYTYGAGERDLSAGDRAWWDNRPTIVDIMRLYQTLIFESSETHRCFEESEVIQTIHVESAEPRQDGIITERFKDSA